MSSETESDVVQAGLKLLYNWGWAWTPDPCASSFRVRGWRVWATRHSHFSYSIMTAHFLQRITSPSPCISGNTPNIAIVFWETAPPVFLPQISGFATVLFPTRPLSCNDEHHHCFCNWLCEVVDTPAEKSHKSRAHLRSACDQVTKLLHARSRYGHSHSRYQRGSQSKLTLRMAQTGPPEILQTSDHIPVLSSTKGKVQYSQSPVQFLLKSGKFPWADLAAHFLELWPRVIHFSFIAFLPVVAGGAYILLVFIFIPLPQLAPKAFFSILHRCLANQKHRTTWIQVKTLKCRNKSIEAEHGWEPLIVRNAYLLYLNCFRPSPWLDTVNCFIFI